MPSVKPLSWNDTESLKVDCTSCGAKAGEWCVYVDTVVGEIQPYADVNGLRNQTRQRVGQRTLRLHNARRPLYDESGRCRYHIWIWDTEDTGHPVLCTGTRTTSHSEGCYGR